MEIKYGLTRITLAVALMSTMVISCMKQDAVTRGGNPGGGGGGNQQLVLDISSVSVKHANSFLPSLAVTTGVTNYKADAAITTSEATYRQALSSNGNGSAYTPQMSLAQVALVTAFCRAAGAREQGLAIDSPQRVMYPNVSLNTPMSATGFSDAQLQGLVQVAWERFRGESQVPVGMRDMLVQAMKNVYTSLPATVPNAQANTNASKANALGARSVAESGCIMVGSAWESFVNSI